MVWSTINNVLNRKGNTLLKEISHNGIVLRGEALSNFANDYFVNIANTITANLPDSRVFTCFSPPVLVSCFFSPTCMTEVMRIIKGLKNKGSKIMDVHPLLVKENIVVFSQHIEILYNMSVGKAVFPDKLKIARVCPGFKSGLINSIDNYRPISSLPLFSKLFEKLTLARMVSFISRQNILTPVQFGFRSGFSTSHAVIKLVSHIVKAYHDRVYSACFYLDLN